MIAVIDYGMGNLRSVAKAFEAVGAPVIVSSEPSEILKADSVVLPGVGAFKDCMKNLKEKELDRVVHESIESGKPFLGICLGLQLLFDESVEFGCVRGLGIIPGKVTRFDPPVAQSGDERLKVPHMGWNTLSIKKRSPLFESAPEDPWFYFVHSFHVVPDDPEVIATTTNYGIEFVSGIQHKNIYAFQFHPEKSQAMGLSILEKFAQLN
ncbi:MAG: imidazole glycerol phosphate synthase subunit HisH [Nitrospinales bacterium]